MNVIVFGSIGYGGFEDIEQFYDVLSSKGYKLIKHIQAEGMDYRHVKDFRDEKIISEKITQHDVKYIQYADVAVVLTARASWGSAIEMYEAKKQGKFIIVYAENEIPTPWIISYSDAVVKSKDDLFKCLEWCEQQLKKICYLCKSKNNVRYIPKLKKYCCSNCQMQKIKDNFGSITHSIQAIETQLDSTSQKLLKKMGETTEVKQVVFGLREIRKIQEYFPIQERSIKRSYDSVDDDGNYTPHLSKQNWSKFKKLKEIESGKQKLLSQQTELRSGSL